MNPLKPSSLLGLALWFACAGCAINPPAPAAAAPASRPSGAARVQSVFRDATATEPALRTAYDALKGVPVDEDPREWLHVVRDERRPLLARRLAFLAFAKRFIRPDMDLGDVVQRYDLFDWFADDNVLDWTSSAWTPLDKATRDQDGFSGGVYVVGAPRSIQPFRGGLSICFALPRRLGKDEVLERLRAPADGSLKLTHVFVNEPEDD